MAPFSPLPPAKAWEEAAVAERLQVVTSPSITPWTRPHRAPRKVRGTKPPLVRGAVCGRTILRLLDLVGAKIEQSRPGEGAALSTASVLFLACFLASALTSQRGFHALFLAGLQVKGVALNLLDNVFLLHLAFKAT